MISGVNRQLKCESGEAAYLESCAGEQVVYTEAEVPTEHRQSLIRVPCSEWSAIEKEMGDGLQSAGHHMDA